MIHNLHFCLTGEINFHILTMKTNLWGLLWHGCLKFNIKALTRSSAVAVIADRTAAVRSAETTVLCDFYFNAIHCDRSVSTCE